MYLTSSNTEKDVEVDRFNQNRCHPPPFLTGLMCDMICQVAEEAILDVSPFIHFCEKKITFFETENFTELRKDILYEKKNVTFFLKRTNLFLILHPPSILSLDGNFPSHFVL